MGNAIKKLKKNEVSKFYDFEKGVLGRGSFATVRKATRKSDGKVFAIKIVSKSALEKDDLAVVHDEIKIMNEIQHPNCVQLFDMYETKKKIYMVMELLGGGELFDRIIKKSSYSEKEAAAVVKSIVGALGYLHGKGIVHRDLKPENLMYASDGDDSVIKITDFGLAKFRKEKEKMLTACGTPSYVAPEVLKGKGYTKAVDMWSVGVILYILLCGFPPFYADDNKAMYKQIKNAAYDYPKKYWDGVSDSAKDLIDKLLTVDPKKRFSARDVLAHPWIAGDKQSTTKFDSSHIDRMKLMQAKRKLRTVVRKVVAVTRFSRALRKELA